jgi:hypothetical protein
MGASIPLAETGSLDMSKKKDHRQRRRRPFNCVWLFKAIIWLAQATYYVARFLFLLDRN